MRAPPSGHAIENQNTNREEDRTLPARRPETGDLRLTVRSQARPHAAVAQIQNEVASSFFPCVLKKMLSIFFPWFSVMRVVTGVEPDRSSLCKRKQTHQWAYCAQCRPGWGGEVPSSPSLVTFQEAIHFGKLTFTHSVFLETSWMGKLPLSLPGSWADGFTQCGGEIHQVRVLFSLQEKQPGFSPGRGERLCDLARAPSRPGAQTFLATEGAGPLPPPGAVQTVRTSPRGPGSGQPHGRRKRVTVRQGGLTSPHVRPQGSPAQGSVACSSSSSGPSLSRVRPSATP